MQAIIPSWHPLVCSVAQGACTSFGSCAHALCPHCCAASAAQTHTVCFGGRGSSGPQVQVGPLQPQQAHRPPCVAVKKVAATWHSGGARQMQTGAAGRSPQLPKEPGGLRRISAAEIWDHNAADYVVGPRTESHHRCARRRRQQGAVESAEAASRAGGRHAQPPRHCPKLRRDCQHAPTGLRPQKAAPVWQRWASGAPRTLIRLPAADPSHRGAGAAQSQEPQWRRQAAGSGLLAC